MLSFPIPTPTGRPPLPNHSTRPPNAQQILPLHTTDKPLPPHPSASSRTNATSSESGEETRRGIRGWWSRNRQRSKPNGSPGQAELGVKASRTEAGSERRGYDVEVLTQQLANVDFSGSGSQRVRVGYQDQYEGSSTSRAPAVWSLPSTSTRPAIPDSRRILRPPVYAAHVESEMHHSFSAPQLDSSSRIGSSSHQLNDSFLFGSPVRTSNRMTTFNPDSRALERLPDRPATYMDIPKRTAPRSNSQPFLLIPVSPTSPQRYHQSSQPLTPSRKPNSAAQTPRTPRTPHQTPAARTSAVIASPSSTGIKSPGTTTTVQCSGFTQRGQRCKKRVRAVTAYYAIRPHSQAGEENANTLGGSRGDDGRVDLVRAEEEKRFCKVHVGQICEPEGFYFRGSGAGERERWIQFSDYIPGDLEEQTRALLRLTMESPLSANESAGYIYAYELRDLSTDRVGYYKVGRTDNVPRRLNEWAKQCTSHRPTLRDIFPQRDLSSETAQSSQRPMSSVLPGAMENQEAQCMAVKRLEKLIHIELSARQVTVDVTQMNPLTALHTGRPCVDCLTTHREIFAVPRQGGAEGRNEYETILRPVILRWQRFVDDTTL